MKTRGCAAGAGPSRLAPGVHVVKCMRVALRAALFGVTTAFLISCAATTAEDDAIEDDAIEDDAPTAAVEADLTSASQLRVGQTAHFDKFNVTLLSIKSGKLFEVGLHVKVCALKSSNPVTRAPWSFMTPFGAVRPTTEKTSFAASKLYPTRKVLRVGECAQGIVPFINPDGETITSIRYINSLGNKAVWK